MLAAAAAFAQEARAPTPRVSIVEVQKRIHLGDGDDRSGVYFDLACENCEAVPENQCFDVLMSWHAGLSARTHRKALSHGFVLYPPPEVGNPLRVELAEHEGHPPGKQPSGRHRKDGCVVGPELDFGEPVELGLQPREPTVSIAGASIEENRDDDEPPWVFVSMECEGCGPVPEAQCVDARITWDGENAALMVLFSRAHSPGFWFPFRTGRVDITLVEHQDHSEWPVSGEHQQDGCLPGPRLAFGPAVRIFLHDGPDGHE